MKKARKKGQNYLQNIEFYEQNNSIHPKRSFFFVVDDFSFETIILLHNIRQSNILINNSFSYV